MSSTTAIENRLANYRPALENAIDHRTSSATTDAEVGDGEVVEFDWQPRSAGDATKRNRLVVGAASVALVAGLAAILATRGTPAPSPPNSLVPVEAVSATVVTVEEPAVGTGPVPIDTTFGSSVDCPADTGTFATGTLYLGGPASDQNLATEGFIFSLPSGVASVDVAVKAIEQAVVGLDCGIAGTSSTDGGVIEVTVSPPAVPAPLLIEVAVSERDGAVGLTEMSSGTTFETTSSGQVPTLRLLDGVPSSAATVSVRFKKGDDVWHLLAAPTAGVDIALGGSGG